MPPEFPGLRKPNVDSIVLTLFFGFFMKFPSVWCVSLLVRHLSPYKPQSHGLKWPEDAKGSQSRCIKINNDHYDHMQMFFVVYTLSWFGYFRGLFYIPRLIVLLIRALTFVIQYMHHIRKTCISFCFCIFHPCDYKLTYWHHFERIFLWNLFICMSLFSRIF